jgi:hypothetical protein
MVASDSFDTAPPEELMLDVELLPVVTIELPELDMHVLCRCFTELLGLIVFKPRNLIAWT